MVREGNKKLSLGRLADFRKSIAKESEQRVGEKVVRRSRNLFSLLV